MTAVWLEPLHPRHGPALERIVSDPAVSESYPPPFSPGGAVAWITVARVRAELGREYRCALIASSEGVDDSPAVVGMCSLTEIATASRSAALSYLVGRSHAGRGLATWAARELARFGFQRLGLEELRSYTMAANAASLRVLSKVGFRVVAERGDSISCHRLRADEFR